MLKYRTITAFCLVPILLVLMWFLPMLWWGIFMALVMAVAAWEWAGLIWSKENMPQAGIIYAFVLLVCMFGSIVLPTMTVFIIAVLAWIWGFIAVVSYARGGQGFGLQHRVVRILFGVLTIVPCWQAAIMLRQTVIGPLLLLTALVTIWAIDTGAYFAGRFLGKRLLIKRVSPKKTWAGLWGGLTLALVIAFIFACISFRNYSWSMILWTTLIGFVSAWFAILGDLVESMLKRQANVKDSGKLLPGHGGLLDRIDSVLSALPVFAIGMVLLFHFANWHPI